MEKIQQLLQQLWLQVPRLPQETLTGYVEQIGIQPEVVMLLCGILTIFTAILCVATGIRTVWLSKTLSVRKAKQYIIKRHTIEVKTIPTMPPLQLQEYEEVTVGKKEARPLLTETVPEDAQRLLEKLYTYATTDNGWSVTGQTP